MIWLKFVDEKKKSTLTLMPFTNKIKFAFKFNMIACCDLFFCEFDPIKLFKIGVDVHNQV